MKFHKKYIFRRCSKSARRSPQIEYTLGGWRGTGKVVLPAGYIAVDAKVGKVHGWDEAWRAALHITNRVTLCEKKYKSKTKKNIRKILKKKATRRKKNRRIPRNCKTNKLKVCGTNANGIKSKV